MNCGVYSNIPKGIDDDNVKNIGREKLQYHNKINKKYKDVRTKNYILNKKDRQRRQGKDVRKDTK